MLQPPAPSATLPLVLFLSWLPSSCLLAASNPALLHLGLLEPPLLPLPCSTLPTPATPPPPPAPEAAAGCPCSRALRCTRAAACPAAAPTLPPRCALTVAGVPALGLGLSSCACAGTGVDLLGLADDEAVLDQLPHVLPCRWQGGADQPPAAAGHALPGTRCPTWHPTWPTASRQGRIPGRSRRPCCIRADAPRPKLAVAAAGCSFARSMPPTAAWWRWQDSLELAMEMSATSLGSSHTCSSTAAQS